MHGNRSLLAKAFLLCLLSLTILPHKLFAQSVNAPEFSSFEPVEAPDMVNLSTGDLTYVLPLIEVPAPGGSYPVSIHYHAGIAVDQEASWTGLGWNLNVGGINRNVNGTPDDWKRVQSNSFIWNPGETDKFWSVSAMVGVSRYASVGLGLNWSSFKSLGGDVSFGLGIKDTPLRASVSYGTNGASAGIGLQGTNGIGIQTGVSVSPEGELGSRASLNLGSGYAGQSLGLNTDTKGVSVNYSSRLGSAPATTMSSMVSADDWSVTMQNHYVPILTPFFSSDISWGKRKYFMFKESEINVYGSLYSSDAYEQAVGPTAYDGIQNGSTSMDVYIHPTRPDEIGERTEYDNNRFTFMAYDQYMLTVEGLGGTLQPRIYQNGTIFSKADNLGKVGNDEYIYRYNFGSSKITKSQDQIYFYFDKTYDSRHRILSKEIQHNGSSSYSAMWDYDPVGTNNTSTSQNYYQSIDRKHGARVVEYFTNDQIINDPSGSTFRGFLESEDLTSRSDFDLDAIGAFTVIAEDGMTYHFSIPVHSKYQLTQIFDGNSVSIDEQNAMYATNWLLTAITGPDYYDANESDRPDIGDDGYWVVFRYGKWNDGYLWQNPYHSADVIDDAEIKRFGVKESYYLDAIQTETHTALFIKELRDDSKGSSIDGQEFEFNRQIREEVSIPLYDLSANYNFTGGSSLSSFSGLSKVTSNEWYHVKIDPTLEASVLGLKKVILLKNEELPHTITQLRELGSGLNAGSSQVELYEKTYIRGIKIRYPATLGGVEQWNSQLLDPHSIFEKEQTRTFHNHFSDNVIDESDIINLNLNQIESVALSYNYKLASNTPNSHATANANDGSKLKGKLTLTEVDFYGLNEIKYAPSYKFDYYDLGDYDKNSFDNWGFYAPESKLDYRTKNSVHNWSLKEIVEPQGRKIEIEYESDRYEYEAARCEVGLYKREIRQFNSAAWPNGYEWQEEYVPAQDFDHGFGGGVRVSKITYAGGNQSFQREYDYFEGVTSFSPGRYDLDEDYYALNGIQPNQVITRFSQSSDYPIHSGAISRNNHHFIPYQSDLPSPNVFYGKVTTTDKDIQGDALSRVDYEFETLDRASDCIDPYVSFKLGNKFSVSTVQAEVGIDGSGDWEHREVKTLGRQIIRDNTAQVGRLNSITVYNSFNELVDRKVNTYLDIDIDGDDDDDYGVSQETFHTIARYIKFWDDRAKFSSTYYITSSSKIEFPAPVLSEMNTFKNGASSSISYSDFDENTGVPLRSTYTNSFGKFYTSVITPAYSKYFGMESPLVGLPTKNMLIQKAGEKLYSDGKLISSSTTSWSNTWQKRTYDSGSQYFTWQAAPTQQNVWRKQGEYVWNSLLIDPQANINETDGALIEASSSSEKFVAYDYATPTNNDADHWVNASTTSRYDEYSRPIEVIDPNGVKSCMKYDDDNQLLVTSNLGKYEEVYFSSAEDFISSTNSFASELSVGTGTVWGSIAHTGGFSVQLSSGEKTFITKQLPNDLDYDNYQLSVWVKASQVNEVKLYAKRSNGTGNPVESSGYTLRAGDWYLVQLTVDASAMNGSGEIEFGVENGGFTAYVDDFRFHPAGASLAGYVYNQYGQITHVLDANNIGMEYGYTDAGELEEIKREVADQNPGDGGFKLMSRQNKIYGRGL